MAIPDYQAMMLPALEFYADQKEHFLGDVMEGVADHFKLSEEERRTLLPSGSQVVYENRVGWAVTYLAKAGLLVRVRRGYAKISARGLEVLAKKPKSIDGAFLRQFKEFQEFKALRHARGKDSEEEKPVPADEASKTPEEALEVAHETLRENLASELLQRLKACSPRFFEKLVVDVIVKMGYGGSRQDAGKAIGRSGDGGVDGSIKEDRLGLDTIYIQAKKWESTVGRPEVQKFVGALTGQRARKGLFITTSDFSDEAQDYASRIETKVVLINGETLADLMIEHNVGVSKTAVYEVKRVDTDFFAEE
jgi:restriction system protein